MLQFLVIKYCNQAAAAAADATHAALLCCGDALFVPCISSDRRLDCVLIAIYEFREQAKRQHMRLWQMACVVIGPEFYRVPI